MKILETRVISEPLSNITQAFLLVLVRGISWRLIIHMLDLTEREHEKYFLMEHISWIWTSLHFTQVPFQLQESSWCDQLEHLLHTGFFILSFLTISCFLSSIEVLNPGQSLILFEIPSVPYLVLYLCACMLQTGQILSAPWTTAVVFVFWHFPGWLLWHVVHFRVQRLKIY